MKLFRILHHDTPRYAALEGGTLRLLDASELVAALAVRETGGEEVPLESAKLLAPVTPSKLVCVGRNYAEHAKELGNEAPTEPILFLKPPSAVIDPGATIVRPPQSQRVDFEGELTLVIGRRARNVRAADWRQVVAGFCCANDVTARDIQKRDVQFTRGKSFDTFAPLGPCIETELDVSDLGVVTRLNGEVKQNGRTSQMIFTPAFLVEFITSVMTLEPGDVILTGTPAGVGPMAGGDTVEVEIEGIGTLRNPVV